MQLAWSVKLKPTAGQHAAMLRTVERFNLACDAIAEVAFRERCAARISLHRLVYYDVRRQFGMPAQLAIRAIARVSDAYSRDRTIRPRFRAHGAIPYDERIMTWKRPDQVSLITLSGRELVSAVPTTRGGGVAHHGHGQALLVYRDRTFYLNILMDIPEPATMRITDYLGVDVGIVNIVADSDGCAYSGKTIDRQRRIFAHRRRNLQRKGTKAAKRKLRRIRRKQARFQSDTNHCISKRVVANAQGTGRGIALEELRGIRDRTTVRKRQRARHVNWAFAQLRKFITYKARLAGVPVVFVDPRNTSRTCLACGYSDKANRPSQARFECVVCGFAGPADAVAACVIMARARADAMQPKVSDARVYAPVAPGTSHQH